MPWRAPLHDDDFPSLGWNLLDWASSHLPSPRDPNSPLLFTDEQAMQLVEWFRLDPLTGRLVYRRGYSRRSKGWGKSPVEGLKAIAEFAGPVRFGGWDANGEPVGIPWGRKDAPRAWVQIGAISEDQTDNTWSVIHYLLTENDGKAADALRIDAGLTRCYLRDQPGAKLEPVTASAGSREGQPITYGVIDESHLMYPSNGGVKLARTIRRNVAKMGGRSYETTNAPLLGLDSVAESSMNAVRNGAPGIFADEVEAPREIDGVAVDLGAPDEILVRALDVAYGGKRGSWWVDRPRLVADMRDTAANPFEESARFFFNWPYQDGVSARIIPLDTWAALSNRPDPADDVAVAKFNAEAREWPRALTWDVSPDRAKSSIGWVALRGDGSFQGQIVECKDGTDWVAARMAEYAKNAGEVVIAVGISTSSPGNALTPDVKSAFERNGLRWATGEGGNVINVSGASYSAACGDWYDKTMSGSYHHSGQDWLGDAVAAATWKTSGDTKSFDRRNTKADITALCTQAVALRALQVAPKVEVHEHFAIVL